MKKKREFKFVEKVHKKKFEKEKFINKKTRFENCIQLSYRIAKILLTKKNLYFKTKFVQMNSTKHYPPLILCV